MLSIYPIQNLEIFTKQVFETDFCTMLSTEFSILFSTEHSFLIHILADLEKARIKQSRDLFLLEEKSRKIIRKRVGF